LGKGEAEVVTTPWIARGHSRETTFPHDLTDPAAIATHLTTLAQQVTHDAADAGRTITRVTVKIRTTPFQTRTRQTKLPAPHHRPRNHHPHRPRHPRPPRPHPPRPPHRRGRRIHDAEILNRQCEPHITRPMTMVYMLRRPAPAHHAQTMLRRMR
ncbi:hypothetical protein HCN51_18375, partial [Nonomuraea sp. FMUSA5-5]|nr:hypothetical protein [Nonomuraea sp. FMUSA5-5]